MRECVPSRSNKPFSVEHDFIEHGSHAGTRTLRAHVVVELCEFGKYAFDQCASGRVVDGFCG